MPVSSIGFDLASRPIIEVYLSTCEWERELFLAQGRTFPPSLLIQALVDTGASRSLVDLAILERLGVAPASEDVVLFTASGGGAQTRKAYMVDVALAGDRHGPIANDLLVLGAPVADDLRVDMLLGRDVLAACILTYDGIDRRFTLAYNPPPTSS